MTAARRPLSFADVLSVAVPMTLGHLSTPLVGVVAIGVVGRTGDAAAVGGVALGAIVCDLVFSLFYFLRAGTTGLAARATGAGDVAELRAVLVRALAVALVFGTVVAILSGVIVDLGMAIVGGEPAVREATRAYAGVRLWSAPAILFGQAVFGWYLGRGRAGIGLLLQTVLNATNIALALILVGHFGMGPRGAALAGVVAEVVAGLLGAALVAGEWRRGVRPDRARIFDRDAFAGLVAVNRDIMIRTFVLLAAFTFFSRQSAAQGAVVLAANAVLEKFFLTTAYFLDGFAAAAETFVGRAVGARDRVGFDRALWLTSAGGATLALVAALVVFFAGSAAIDLMSADPGVAATARTHLVWAAVTPLAGVLAFEMDGVFIGAGWTRDMAAMMVASLVVFFALWAVLFPAFGNHGLWAAFVAFLSVRGLTLAAVVPRRARAALGGAAEIRADGPTAP